MKHSQNKDKIFFRLACSKFEAKNVWTLRGVIYVKNGSNIIPCKTIADVAKICSLETPL